MSEPYVGASHLTVVTEKARELYAAACEQAAARAAANPSLDRRGHPKVHQMQAWERVPGEIQRLWLRKAREVLEQEEKDL